VKVTPMRPPVVDLSTVVETRTELEAAGRLHGHLAASALRLAARIDESTTVMGYAPLVKQLQATMTEALKGSQTKRTVVDELRSKRDAKRAG
jgi:hypothetical protein